MAASRNRRDFEGKYMASLAVCNGVKEIESALLNSAKDAASKQQPANCEKRVYRTQLLNLRLLEVKDVSRTMSISVPTESVRPLLSSVKFFEAIEGSFEEIAQRLAERLSALVLQSIRSAVGAIANGNSADGTCIDAEELFAANPSESTMKSAILSKLHALLVALSEIPTPLRRFRHFVSAAFLSHLFLGIERECLLPSELRGVLGMNEVLFLNNLLRNFEAMLGEFGLIELRALSSRDFADFPELTRIHGIIVVYLSNTVEIMEALKTRVRTREHHRLRRPSKGVDDGVINMGLLRDDESKRREEAPFVEGHTLLLLLKHRADVMGDAVAVRFMARFKFTFCEDVDAEQEAVAAGNDRWKKKLFQMTALFKKKTNSLSAVGRSNSLNLIGANERKHRTSSLASEWSE